MARREEPEEFQEGLATYFEKCAELVRQYADVIEQRYARPALALWIRNFKEKPITMTFIAILSILSVLPALSFVGISVFIISSIVFLAAVSAIMACLVTESIIVSIGICTMCSLVLVAVLATVFFLSVYSVIRFGLLVRSNGRSGFKEWAMETRQHLLPVKGVEEEEKPNPPDVATQHPVSDYASHSDD
ncbi:hypothetical protein PISMIDRAFT_198829 [Pisolithus microcarpus 441]|uniref:Uncharacterized protein n=1 Tax=Pisolithus microcarpus 441 TaxID=765257 RepID=A0A0C9YN14_9AGAM|nr:hypothetical protein BKA83DRAFT_198829 [Pisolithus microcarpus]KIK18101.1 hypothetical protein PISMIDRAFT_198829 [Pisolithus microcarpus 441]